MYFGKTESDPDWEAALKLWHDQKDDLLAGRTFKVTGDGLTAADLANRYLSTKQHQVDTKEITQRQFENLHTACTIVVGHFEKKRLVDDPGSGDLEALKVSLARTQAAWALDGCAPMRRRHR